jgi:hypothetical protein
LEHIFHLNLGIWFLKIKAIDYFFHRMTLLVETKHSHLSRARNNFFIFCLLKIGDQDAD